MKKVGLGLLAVSVLAVIGTMVWAMVTEADDTPVVIYIIFGTAGIGALILLAVAVYERKKQEKKETFERRDN
ncbi:MAG: hypothetical protein GX631_04290 [Dehalococcoidales bacterium]|jgi:uncharacterized membrane protein YuzA (DUF378 family)|nr:hypothetical protein [Dehalococcoidales bacterium]